jgi:hypothetical protein
MDWLKKVENVLEQESEVWLAYLHGQKYEDLAHLSASKNKYSGFFIRLCIWLYSITKQTRIRYNPSNSKCKFLIYAGTVNQKNSLNQTLLSLRSKGESVCAIAPKKILSKKNIIDKNYLVKNLGLLEFFKSILLFSIRFLSLRSQLKKKNSKLFKNKLNVFLNVYNELVYFERLLKETNPDYVIVSNDHNAANRVILALARNSGIKTVYMQHASVSKLFPALNVNYAFLDGEFALNIYRQCEHNLPNKNFLIENREAFLSGQKKKLEKVRGVKKHKIGVALNSLDSIKDMVKLIENLSLLNIPIKVRWHPGLSKKTIKELIDKIDKYKVELSDPKADSLKYFFSDMKCLISGNSSIHLEAALSDVFPIYYEVTPSDLKDYYGYVENRLARNCSSLVDLNKVIKEAMSGVESVNVSAIKFYSSTYSTRWEGQEGELVAETMIRLSKDQSPELKPVKLILE